MLMPPKAPSRTIGSKSGVIPAIRAAGAGCSGPVPVPIQASSPIVTMCVAESPEPMVRSRATSGLVTTVPLYCWPSTELIVTR